MKQPNRSLFSSFILHPSAFNFQADSFGGVLRSKPMLGGITQQRLVPDEFLGPLVEFPPGPVDAEALRRSFADNGYVLLHGALDLDEVAAARHEAFTRLAEME